MNPSDVSVRKIFSDSLNFLNLKMKDFLYAYIATTVIFLGLGILKQVIVGPSGENNLLVGIVEFIFYTFLTIWLFIHIVDLKKPGHYRNLTVITFLYLCFRYILNSLLYGLWVFLGLLLFVVPGLIFIVRYFFVPDLSIYEVNSETSLFELSKKITKGHIWTMGLILSVLAVFGMLSFYMDYVLVGLKLHWLSLALKPIDSAIFIFSRIVNVHLLLTLLGHLHLKEHSHLSS